jgi:squalene-hopene/tetraprenyl-beta-curcumene cyclase
MRIGSPRRLLCRAGAALAACASLAAGDGPEIYQYRSATVAIARAHAGEPKLEQLSAERALAYIDQGAEAWTETRKCVSCHTNGTYALIRPALSPRFGKPPAALREFLEATLERQRATPREELLRGVKSAQVIHTAAGLAEWDAHVLGRLTPATARALDLVFELQRENGAWVRPSDCWPPFESDIYQEATVAALAATTAPGWLASVAGPARGRVERLRHFLRTEAPPHDYARVWLLRAAARWPGLLSREQSRELVAMLWKHQRPDGGWSMRTFAAPEAWGTGKRAERLRAEPDRADPPSDGHQTGLVLLALSEAGVSRSDPRVRRALDWLATNQRVSGRWWTRSLNTDQFNFITYSGTAYSLLALGRFGALR